MEKMEKEEKKEEAIFLYLQGFTISGIARDLGKPKSTVWRWVNEAKVSKRELKKREIFEDEIWERVVATLLFKNREKGRTRTLSISQIYREWAGRLKEIGINSERTFRRRLEEFIKARFGGWEKLELKRRDKEEISQFKKPKGKLQREQGVWEVDMTGFNWRGESYFLLCARERWSGFYLDCLAVKTKEDTNATYYNKAFSALDVAKFLISLFRTFGIPRKIITDNEMVLTSELIERGLRMLDIGITRTRPFNPQQKLIERSFRDLKDNLRYALAKHPEIGFEEAIAMAIDKYNKESHRFEHFNEPVIPEILHNTIEYRKVEEDELRRAFREKFIRTVRNHTIVIDGLRYEFIYDFDGRMGEIGRKRKAPEVLCLRDLENASFLEVWDKDGKSFLGYAKLISTDVPSLDTTELRGIKNKEKRIERRQRKLKEELIKLEIEQQELQQLQQQQATDFFEIFNNLESSQPAPQPQSQPEEEELDPIKLFLGGEES